MESCLDLCCSRGFIYAGLESSLECYCGDVDTEYDVLGRLPDSQCGHRCGGNNGERCGGTFEIQIYDCSK